MDDWSAGGLVLRRGHEIGRRQRAAGRRRAIGGPTRATSDGYGAQSVGGAEEVFGGVIALVADVQVVSDLAAESVVVADLSALPVEAVVVVPDRVESHQPAASWRALDRIAILVDERLYERVLAGTDGRGPPRQW